MNVHSHTVTGGYTDREGRFWVYLRALPKPVQSDKAWPEGTSVMLVNGRAVKP